MKRDIPILFLSDEDIKNSNYKLAFNQGIYHKEYAEFIVRVRNEGETIIYLEDKKCYAIVKEC